MSFLVTFGVVHKFQNDACSQKFRKQKKKVTVILCPNMFLDFQNNIGQKQLYRKKNLIAYVAFRNYPEISGISNKKTGTYQSGRGFINNYDNDIQFLPFCQFLGPSQKVTLVVFFWNPYFRTLGKGFTGITFYCIVILFSFLLLYVKS